MNESNKWRFPGNHHTQDRGLSDADSEMFRKDPFAGLARETVQNSIDARADKRKPVRVEFQSFDISRDKIPDIDNVKEQIIAAIETWKDKSKNADMMEQLNSMFKNIRKQTIHCCRISDYNTKGLEGIGTVEGEEEISSYHNFVKGSGMSDKEETSGGSKGVGKNACFVNSGFSTIFCSTKTIDGQMGYIGISKLCSAKIPNSDTNEKTLGIGYYGSNDENFSVRGLLNLDENSLRTECGTDIYILGFHDDVTWKNEVIKKILDSFMCAIYFDDLIVKVNGKQISKDNLKNCVFDRSIIDPTKNSDKDIIMQYLLLTECEFPKEITIDGYGDARLYFLDCSDKYSEYYTSKFSCTMVRYPGMKICEQPIKLSIPFAALCIIEDNELNKALRKIENPQHTDWETKRLNDKPQEQKEISRIIKDLRAQITSIIRERLAATSGEKVELKGSENFISIKTESSQSSKLTSINQNRDKSTKYSIAPKPVKVKTYDVDAQFDDVDGNGISLDYGGDESSELEMSFAGSGNTNSSKEHLYPTEYIANIPIGENKQPLLKPTELKSTSYSLIAIDETNYGRFEIKMNPEIDDQYVTVQIYKADANNVLQPINITKASLDGTDLQIDDSGSIHLSFKKGVKTTLVVDSTENEPFSGEAKIYAYRK